MAKIRWFFGQFFQGQVSFEFSVQKKFFETLKQLSFIRFGRQRVALFNLNMFNGGRVICVGYADDGSLLMSHNNLPYLFMKMNNALKDCQRWAQDLGIDISPEKPKYMLFARKRRP